jgi:phage/plasmid primase-like uncharacterized protein
VGREKAAEAAAAIGGFVLLPAFAEQDAGSDWNDLVRGQGRDAAQQQVRDAFAVAARERMALDHALGHGDKPDLSSASMSMRNRDSVQKLELER